MKFICFLDDELNCRAFVEELCKVASREELTQFMEQLRRTCTGFQTERISFISDKSQEVTDAITILNQVNWLVKEYVFNY